MVKMSIRNKRSRLFALNTAFSVLNQIISILCGLILPQRMLVYFGSEMNGLISSISQFLGFISFMQMGVGVVVQASWYKPLAEGDTTQISKIYKSAQKFFRKIGKIFIVYTVVVAVIYPVVVNNNFEHIFVSAMILVIAINLFGQYYWGITNSLLLNADQKAFIPLVIQSIVAILNVVVCLILMKLGVSVLYVKLFSVMVCLINPVALSLYVKKNYAIDINVNLTDEPIKQKWSGFGQHISAVVVDNTDIIVLTLFSTLENVSIYYVYYLVVYSVRNLLVSITGGVQSLFGDMLARDEKNQLKHVFQAFEMAFSFMVTLIYSCVMSLIVPFVQVYTKDITDTNYVVPIFGILITLAYAIFCYRTVYYTLIKAAGRFKETQLAAIFEALINVLISVICVKKFGLIGVAIGTIVAVLYRTCYCAWYCSREFISQGLGRFLKMSVLNTILYFSTYAICKSVKLNAISYIAWIVMAIKVVLICLVVCIIGYMITFNKETVFTVGFIKNRIRRKNKSEDS